MLAESSTNQISFCRGGFENRYPEVVGLSGVAVLLAILALNLRSPFGPFLVSLWLLLSMWIRFRGRNGHLILVELTNAGVLIHGWSLSPTVLHGWTEINDVTIGQDQQGEQNVQLHLGPETISLPQKLRIDRTEADIDDVMGHIQDFRQRYGPR